MGGTKMRKHETPRSVVALAAAVRRLGGLPLKFGQLVASVPSIVGDDLAAAFRPCLDAVDVDSRCDAAALVSGALGDRAHALAHVDAVPIAAGSVAVVCAATRHDGTRVALKVLRPGARRKFTRDLRLLRFAVRLAARHSADDGIRRLPELLEGFAAQVRAELDFRAEARSTVEFGAFLRRHGFTRVAVPEVHEDLCSDTVLATTLIDGVPVDAAGVRTGSGPGSMAAGLGELMRAWTTAALELGWFHADLHAGNLLVRGDGVIVLLDWGGVVGLDPDARSLLAALVATAEGAEGAAERLGSAICAALPGLSGTSRESTEMLATVALTTPGALVRIGELLESLQSSLGISATSLIPSGSGLTAVFRQLLYVERYSAAHLADSSLLDLLRPRGEAALAA